MFLTRSEEKGLITQYYKTIDFRICRVADWSIMVFSTTPKNETDSDGDVIESTYFAWHIDHAFAQKIIENPAAFQASLLSKSTKKDPDFSLSTQDALEKLTKIREEVKNGEREANIDPDFENMLKGQKMKGIEHLIQEFGNPPVFSKVKFWQVMLAFFSYPFGVAWFMVGDRKGGTRMLGALGIGLVAMALFMPLGIPFMAYMVINVFVFYFKLFLGRVRDKEGKTVLTKGRQKEIAKEIETYNRYQKELAGGSVNE